MKRILSAFFIIFLSTLMLSQRTVMTWIPPYAINKCYSNLTKVADDTWIKDGITHIGLQFWVPGEDGDIVYVSNYQYQNVGNLDSEVEMFVDWGGQNNVKIMLCLFNVREAGFDWKIARKAYYQNPTKSINNILAIVDKFSLDGVDVDFEDGDSFNNIDNKEYYLDFLYYLSDSLTARGKVLSVDVAPTPCYGTPGTDWATEINEYVDFVNYMGYYDYYEANEATFWCKNNTSVNNQSFFKYSYVRDYAAARGAEVAKINFGIASWNQPNIGATGGSWGGKSLIDHLDDIKSIAPEAGIAIWDLQLSAGGLWNQSSTWRGLSEFIENSPSSLETVEASRYLDHDLIALENLDVTVVNLLGTDLEQLVLRKGERLDLSKYQGVVIVKFETSVGQFFTKKLIKP